MTPRHVIVLVVDALRFDALSCSTERLYLEAAGLAHLPRTPNLDRVAESGVRFSQAVSTSTYTTSAHASLFSGLRPPAHGVRAFFRTGLHPGARTLAERLAGAGFATVRSDEFGCFPLFGLDRGFQADCAGDDRAAVDALARAHRRGDRALLFLHVFDVHEPYGHSLAGGDPQQEATFLARLGALEAKAGVRGDGGLLERFVAVRQAIERSAPGRRVLFQLYLDGVNAFDRGRLHRLLRALDESALLDESLLVVLSDHGEADYGHTFGHGGPLVEEAIRIPLLMRAPGLLPRGLAVPWQVSLVDVAPTVLDALGVRDDGPPMHGRSLLPLVRGEEAADREAYAEVWAERGSYFQNLAAIRDAAARGTLPLDDGGALLHQRALRSPRWKGIALGEDPRGASPPPEDPDDEAFVTLLYARYFRRPPDEAGLRHHVALLRSGRMGRDAMARFFREHPLEGGPGFRLYDLVADPFERKDLLAPRLHRADLEALGDRMLRRFEEIEDEVGIPAPLSIGDSDPDGIAERMKKLGYL